MSFGIVICSTCSREVHQDGDRALANGWRHCEDRSPICGGAHAAYPKSEFDIKGRWCGRDRGPMESYREELPEVDMGAVRAERAAMASAAYPNDQGNYVRRRRRGE